MPGSKPNRKRQLEEWLSARPTGEITDQDWQEALTALAPVSEGYLRKLLRATGRPLSPLVEGVVQDSFDELERTLRRMTQVYEGADRQTAVRSRRLVITAKDHARWAAAGRNATAAKKAEKHEMVRWMLVWLENPAIFPIWADLRRRSAPAAGDAPDQH